jgi:uncharacterized protein
MPYRAALITGVNRHGIGLEFAAALPAATNLLLAGRRHEELTVIRRSLHYANREIGLLAADLSVPQQRDSLIKAATKMHVDLMICNAAAVKYGSFLSKPGGEELNSVEVNVVALVHLLHTLLPSMIDEAKTRGGRAGCIVMSSTAAINDLPKPGMAVYAASKAFALQLVRSLADELRREPIDFLALCPSYTATKHFERAGIPTNHLTKPMLTPEQVASEGLAQLGRTIVHVYRGS